jgi:hypothetical protein
VVKKAVKAKIEEYQNIKRRRKVYMQKIEENAFEWRKEV